MSQLQQAKREAKRLLKLSQENDSAIKIKTLAEARKYIAALKGYHSWYDYEENLKRQDFIKGIPVPEKETSLDMEDSVLDYFLQKDEFIIHLKEKSQEVLSVVENIPHIPAVLAEMKKKRFQPSEKWLLNSFPCTLIGTTGSGKTEVWLSQARQWIANGEGFIGMDGKGDVSTFFKIYGTASQANRIKDVLALNLMTHESRTERNSNSFDPINPLIGHEGIFKILFGEKIGVVVHAIALQAQSNDMLLDSHSIKSMLMLPNLISWEKNGIFGESATKKISEYLKQNLEINGLYKELSEDEKDDVLLKHADFCKTAKDVIEIIKSYEDLGVFSKTPEIDMRDVFLNKKILMIYMPSLEKSWNVMSVLANSIFAQIWKIAYQIEKEIDYKPCFLQNIVVDEASYCISNSLAEIVFKKLPKNSNFVFTSQDFNFYRNNNVITHALSVSKTVILLHQYEPMPITLKGRIVENVQKNLHVLHKNNQDLRDLREGEAYVYMEVENNSVETNPYDYKYILGNDSKYGGLGYEKKPENRQELQYKDFVNSKASAYFERLRLTYIGERVDMNVRLNRLDSKTKIIRSFPLSELIG